MNPQERMILAQKLSAQRGTPPPTGGPPPMVGPEAQAQAPDPMAVVGNVKVMLAKAMEMLSSLGPGGA